MRKDKASLLLHPVFIISLAVLLLNDFYWKYSYHNWLTGKLSDFAGLIVLPVFLLALLPKLSKPGAVLFSALFFSWWKSSFSQPVIHLFNKTLSLPVDRVVDISDTIALPVLFLVPFLQPVTFKLKAFLQHGLKYSLALVTIVSLCATSMPYRRGLYLHAEENEVYFDESIKVDKSEAEVLQTLHSKNIVVKRDSIEYAPVANQPWLYHRIFNEKDSTVSWQRVNMDSTLYIKTESFPYYFIRDFTNGEVKLWRIRFRIVPNKKNTKCTITIVSFQVPKEKDVYSMDRKERKQYKQALEQLFH